MHWMLPPLLLGLSQTPPATAEDVGTWAGHHVVHGKREVPVLGTLETRTDTWLLARTRREGDALVLRQRACKVEVARVAGVRISMSAHRLPENEVRFVPAGEGYRSHAVHAWGREDVDRDGHPGFTVDVRAPMCGGSLYVTNRSVTSATARSFGSALRGTHRVRVQQTVLGAEGRCLAATARDTDETVKGSFSYAPVPEGTTCADLERSGWPVGS